MSDDDHCPEEQNNGPVVPLWLVVEQKMLEARANAPKSTKIVRKKSTYNKNIVLTKQQLLQMTSRSSDTEEEEDDDDDDDTDGCGNETITTAPTDDSYQANDPPSPSLTAAMTGAAVAATVPGAQRINPHFAGEVPAQPVTATLISHDELEAQIRKQVLSEAIVAEAVVVHDQPTSTAETDSVSTQKGSLPHRKDKWNNLGCIMAGFAITFCLAMAASVALGVIISKNNNNNNNKDPPGWWQLLSPRIMEKDSPQHQAFLWMVQNDKVHLTDFSGNKDGSVDNTFNERNPPLFWDLYTLVTLYHATNGPSNWTRRDNWLNPDVSPCDWYPFDLCDRNNDEDSFGRDGSGQGGFRNRNRRNLQGGGGDQNDGGGDGGGRNKPRVSVARLNLSNNSLVGELPPELGFMQAIKIMDLSHNGLYGMLPAVFGRWRNITEIRLEGNSFEGFAVPSAICRAFSPTEGDIFSMDCGTDVDGQERVVCPCCTVCCANNGSSCEPQT